MVIDLLVFKIALILIAVTALKYYSLHLTNVVFVSAIPIVELVHFTGSVPLVFLSTLTIHFIALLVWTGWYWKNAQEELHDPQRGTCNSLMIMLVFWHAIHFVMLYLNSLR